MGKLGEIENQRIYEFVVKEADDMIAYLEGPEKDGEVGVWERLGSSASTEGGIHMRMADSGSVRSADALLTGGWHEKAARASM